MKRDKQRGHLCRVRVHGAGEKRAADSRTFHRLSHFPFPFSASRGSVFQRRLCGAQDHPRPRRAEALPDETHRAEEEQQGYSRQGWVAAGLSSRCDASRLSQARVYLPVRLEQLLRLPLNDWHRERGEGPSSNICSTRPDSHARAACPPCSNCVLFINPRGTRQCPTAPRHQWGDAEQTEYAARRGIWRD